MLSMTAVAAYAQCECPAINTCNPCQGGLSRLTLQYNGPAASALIVATDVHGQLFSGTITRGSIFAFTGLLANGKFGPTIFMTVNGSLDVSFNSDCASTVKPKGTYGSFVVVTAESVVGGKMCCKPEDAEQIAPNILNCPVVVNVPAGPSCNTAATWTAPTANDNCGILTFTSNRSSGSTFPLGTTPVTYTATDVYGNVSTCTFNVVVTDNSKPVFTSCPQNVSVSAGSACHAAVSWTTPVAADNCSTVTMTSTHTPGADFPLGITAVTYTARDAAGNTATCTFQVEVTSDPPTVNDCPPDIMAVADRSGTAVVTWTPPAVSSPCVQLETENSHNPGDAFPIGSSDVTYNFTNSGEVLATCTFQVIVSADLDGDAVEVAKFITPNGDGIGDAWEIKHIENFDNNKVAVVDRWGGEVYSATGYDNQDVIWKGIGRNGSPVPAGTYFYSIELWLGERHIVMRGAVEVVR